MARHNADQEALGAKDTCLGQHLDHGRSFAALSEISIEATTALSSRLVSAITVSVTAVLRAEEGVNLPKRQSCVRCQPNTLDST